MRYSGIDVTGNITWGTHFCQLYQTREDLIDILVPYFKAGLENNEFCIWITSPPLSAEDAREELRKALPNYGDFETEGQIEIKPYNEWYVKNGVFDPGKVKRSWMEKLDKASNYGYDGLRISGNTSWVREEDLTSFVDYEEEMGKIIGNYKIIALCSYSLYNYYISHEFIDTVIKHQFFLIKSRGDWSLLENRQEKMEEALKKADKHRGRLQTVIDNLPVGLWIIDENGEIVLVNDIATQIFGAEVHSLAEYKTFKRWWADTGEEIPPEELPLIQALNGKSLKEVVVEIEKPDGTHGTHLISAVPIKDSNTKIIGSIAIVQDVAELKKSEKYMQELLEKEHRLREKLQISNLELNRTKNILEETVRKLENSNADLEQFAYVASHDLQEPLRMVSSFTQLLEKRYKGQLDEDADEYIDFIIDGAQRMKDLIDDLLAFSRLNTKAEEFKETNLETVLNDVLTMLNSFIEKNDVLITHNTLPTVMADPTQISQLFQNLLSNAIKFRGNRSPKIHLDTEELEDDWKISISDNGIGISPLNQKRIFNVFTRLHTRQEYEGTGIGLSICKKIVQRHGGRIWVESEKGKGSTFYFTIPKIK